MVQKNSSANKAIKNTIILYIRMILVVCISLYTTRLVVHALGAEDYGIYVLVGGVVATLGFLNSTMSSASTRYIAHSVGTKDRTNVIRTFNTLLFAHISIALALALVIEAGGWIALKYILVIPPERLDAATFVFHCMVIGVSIVVAAVPYDAMITAQEEFWLIASVDIVAAIAKLLIGISLLYTSDVDSLKFYGISILSVQMFIVSAKFFYVRYKFSKLCDLDFRRYVSKDKIRSVSSFAGWNLLGTICSIGTTQISAIILNIFYGVTLNAATGIARQTNNQLRNVSVNMTRALLPQVVKSEGGGDRQKMLSLTMVSAKFSVFLFGVVALPVIFQVEYILDLWLVDTPEYAAVFIQLFLLSGLIEKFTFPLTDAFRAVGKIRDFQITESVILLSNLPLSYLLYKYFGAPVVTIFVLDVLLRIVIIFERLYFAKKLCGLDLGKYFNMVFVRSGAPLMTAALLQGIVFWLGGSGYITLLCSLVVVNVLYLLVFVLLGMNQSERQTIVNFLSIVFRKVKKIRYYQVGE